MSTFEPYFPASAFSGEESVEFHEMLYSHGRVLVRCVSPQIGDQDNPTHSVLLNFGRVLSVRATEDPYEPDSELKNLNFPRCSGGKLQSPFMRSADTPWVNQHAGFSRNLIYHHVLFAWLDRRIEILCESKAPEVFEEKEILFSAKPVETFATNTPSNPAFQRTASGGR